jgi:hypothetical protein
VCVCVCVCVCVRIVAVFSRADLCLSRIVLLVVIRENQSCVSAI